MLPVTVGTCQVSTLPTVALKYPNDEEEDYSPHDLGMAYNAPTPKGDLT